MVIEKVEQNLDYGIVSMTMFVLNCIRRRGYSCRDTAAKVQDGIIRLKDKDGVYRITITKE